MGLRYSIIIIILPIVISIICAFFYIIKRKGQKVYFFANLKILKNVRKKSSFNPLKKLLSVFAVLLFIVITLMLSFLSSRPYEKREFTSTKSGIDIVIALDVSLSMVEEDFAPNRFIASKNAIQEFVDQIEQDRIGLVIFRGETYTLSPLTYDYSIIDYYLERLVVSENYEEDTVGRYILEHGTAIGDAIISSTLKFQEDDERTKVMIFFTDGVANMGYDPIQAAEFAKSKNVKIYSIYIGDPDDYLTFDEGVYGEGLKTVEQIAEITGGKGYPAENINALDSILDDISKLEKTEIEVETNVVKADTPMAMITFSTILLSLYFVFKGIVS